MSDALERLTAALQPMIGTESRVLGDRASTGVLEPLEAMLAAGRCDCGQSLDEHDPLPAPRPWSLGRPCGRGTGTARVPLAHQNFSITGSVYGKKPRDVEAAH